MKKIVLPLLFLPLIAMAQQQETTDSLALQEVVVTGTRNATDVRHLPMTVTVIGRDMLTAEHQTSVLPTVMREVPGLFVTSRSMMGYGVSGGAAGGISMRGISGGAGQMMVLIDGHPQYQGIYGHPISDSYQTMMAERIEVLRGPASVLYGSNAMGGVINIVTRNGLVGNTSECCSNVVGNTSECCNNVVGNTSECCNNGTLGGVHQYTNITLGAGSYGTVQTEASNQVRSGRFSSTVAAQYNRSDNHRPRMGFEQYGGYLKLGYDLNNHWNTYVDANITRFNASQPGTTDKPMWDADQWITRGVVSAALENHYGKTSGALSVYSNFGRHKIDDGTADPTKPTTRYFRSKDALTGVSLYQSIQLFEGNRVTAGVDYMHIYGNAYYTSKETGEILDTPNKQSGKSYRNEIAGYVDFRQDLMDWLTVDIGARVDHHSVTGTEFVPQAGLVVRPIETGEVKAMVSKGFRNPTMREMYLYPPSNTDLEPERLWNYELSWRHRAGCVSYGANLFYIKGDNMILTTQVGNGKKNLNSGKIEHYGCELEASYRINSSWSLNTNHSLLKMKDHDVATAPKYAAFAGAKFHKNRWMATLGLQYLSGVGLDKDSDGFADLTNKDFCLVNASVTFAATRNISLWARGENLLAQKYEINYGYPMPRATFMGGVSIDF